MNDTSNDLASLLVTPVQRIPRYLMLVKELLRYTWPEHGDFADLTVCEKNISAIAIIVDQKAKDAENVQQMHHLENILVGNDFPLLDPRRRFIRMTAVVCEVGGSTLYWLLEISSFVSPFNSENDRVAFFARQRSKTTSCFCSAIW